MSWLIRLQRLSTPEELDTAVAYGSVQSFL